MFLSRKRQRKHSFLKTDFGCLVSNMQCLRRPFRIIIWCKINWTGSPGHRKNGSHFRHVSSHFLTFNLKSNWCLWPLLSWSVQTNISQNYSVVSRCQVGSWLLMVLILPLHTYLKRVISSWMHSQHYTCWSFLGYMESLSSCVLLPKDQVKQCLVRSTG